MRAGILSFLLLTMATAPLAVGASPSRAKCLVSGKELEVTRKTARVHVNGKAHYFCCQDCSKAFASTPEKWVKLREVGCPVVGGVVERADPEARVVVNNGLWYLCCPGCVEGVGNGPAILKELVDVVSGKPFKVTNQSSRSEFKGQLYFFETTAGKAAFEREPAKFAIVFGR